MKIQLILFPKRTFPLSVASASISFPEVLDVNGSFSSIVTSVHERLMVLGFLRQKQDKLNWCGRRHKAEVWWNKLGLSASGISVRFRG